MPPELLRVGDVARLLGVSPDTVRRIPQDLLPLTQGGEKGEHRRYRRQDALEYKAVFLESRRPKDQERIAAAVLSTIPSDTPRQMQSIALATWAGTMGYAVVAICSSFNDVLQLIWEGNIEAVIVYNTQGIGTLDGRLLFQALCTAAGTPLIEADTTETLFVDLGAETLKFTEIMLTDLLAQVLKPGDVTRLVEYSITQYKHAIAEQDDGNGTTPRKRRPAGHRPR